MGEITVYPAGGIGKILNSAVHTTIVEGWDLGVSGFVQNSPKGVKGLYAVH